MTNPRCPSCGVAAILLKDLPAEFLKRALELYYEKPLPQAAWPASYRLMRCEKCTLEFADPLLPGDAGFYKWVTRQPFYYPSLRWEWNEVIEIIRARLASREVSLLEVGCGSGTFLELLKKEPRIHAIGLDTEPGAVEQCKLKGCEAYCEEVEVFIKRNENFLFDYVMAFHCLEHVAAPKVFLASMLSVLSSEGSLFVSTPYSPMSFEKGWFDPMNHPPHHMTRWNAAAYREMARHLGLKVRFRMPQAAGLLKRTCYSLMLRWFGPFTIPAKPKILTTLLRRPASVVAEILQQNAREKIDGVTCADCVLVEFYR